MEVIVYNLGGVEILNRVSVRKAIKMVYAGKARIIEFEESFFGPYPLPKAIELVRYIFAKWNYDEVQCTKHRVHRRDQYICAYCGDKVPKDKATIDHVRPASWGGKLEWDNAVTACFTCNQKKRNRTPEQAGMKLRYKPVKPLRGALV